MSSHSAGRIVLICLGFLVYAVTLFISYMSSNSQVDIGKFAIKMLVKFSIV